MEKKKRATCRVLCAPNIVLPPKNVPTDLTKSCPLINSARLPRVSVIRSPASWFGKCDCPSKSLGAAESQWHKDGRLLSGEGAGARTYDP